MPASGPDEECCGFGVQRVLAPVRVLEGDRAAHGIVEVPLTVDDVAPGRRRRVLQIGHEHLGPGVEGVDDHLAIAGAGDLDPAIEKVGGCRGNLPVRVPDRLRLSQELEIGPRIDGSLALLASMQELLPARIEAAVEGSDEGQSLRAQDRLELRIDRCVDLDPGIHDRLRTVKAIPGTASPADTTAVRPRRRAASDQRRTSHGVLESPAIIAHQSRRMAWSGPTKGAGPLTPPRFCLPSEMTYGR